MLTLNSSILRCSWRLLCLSRGTLDFYATPRNLSPSGPISGNKSHLNYKSSSPMTLRPECLSIFDVSFGKSENIDPVTNPVTVHSITILGRLQGGGNPTGPRVQ